MKTTTGIDYSKLTKRAKGDVCEQFLKLYPNSSIEKIHAAFSQLDPFIEWNEDGSGEYNIWVVWQTRFEKLIK